MMTNNSRGDSTFGWQIKITDGACLALHMAAAAMGQEQAHPVHNGNRTGLSGKTAATHYKGELL